MLFPRQRLARKSPSFKLSQAGFWLAWGGSLPALMAMGEIRIARLMLREGLAWHEEGARRGGSFCKRRLGQLLAEARSSRRGMEQSWQWMELAARHAPGAQTTAARRLMEGRSHRPWPGSASCFCAMPTPHGG